MISDDIVWQTLCYHACCYRVKAEKEDFCRNANNVTGLCTRTSCPLSNSLYCTVRLINGKIYLLVKTAERKQLPSKLWERTKLSTRADQSKTIILNSLRNSFSEKKINRCLDRYTRLREIVKRMRKLQARTGDILYGVKKKTERRDRVREQKAEIAAKLESSIEQGLLEKLNKGIYGDLYDIQKAVSIADGDRGLGQAKRDVIMYTADETGEWEDMDEEAESELPDIEESFSKPMTMKAYKKKLMAKKQTKPHAKQAQPTKRKVMVT